MPHHITLNLRSHYLRGVAAYGSLTLIGARIRTRPRPRPRPRIRTWWLCILAAAMLCVTQMHPRCMTVSTQPLAVSRSQPQSDCIIPPSPSQRLEDSSDARFMHRLLNAGHRNFLLLIAVTHLQTIELTMLSGSVIQSSHRLSANAFVFPFASVSK